MARPGEPGPAEPEARAKARSSAKAPKREAGGGSVTIIGEPHAHPEAPVTITGARPGVDGIYRIDRVGHSSSRSGGFITRLDVREPSADGS